MKAVRASLALCALAGAAAAPGVKITVWKIG